MVSANKPPILTDTLGEYRIDPDEIDPSVLYRASDGGTSETTRHVRELREKLADTQERLRCAEGRAAHFEQILKGVGELRYWRIRCAFYSAGSLPIRCFRALKILLGGLVPTRLHAPWQTFKVEARAANALPLGWLNLGGACLRLLGAFVSTFFAPLVPQIIKRPFHRWANHLQLRAEQRRNRFAPHPWPSNRPLVSIFLLAPENSTHASSSCTSGEAALHESLETTLHSLAGQTWCDYEVVLIGCNYSDTLSATHTKLSTRFPVVSIPEEPDQLTHANYIPQLLDLAARCARGKYLCILQAGDTVPLTYLEKSLFILESEGRSIVASSTDLLAEGRSTVPTLLEPAATLGGCTPELSPAISHSAVFERRLLLKSSKTLRRSGYPAFGSHSFWYSLLLNGGRAKLFAVEGGTRQAVADADRSDAQAQAAHLSPAVIAHFAKRIKSEQGRQFAVSSALRNLVARGKQRDMSQGNHILLALPFLVVGGADRRFLELAKFLTARGYEVTIVTTEPTDPRLIDTSKEFHTITPRIFHLPRFLSVGGFSTSGHTALFLEHIIRQHAITAIIVGGSAATYEALPHLKQEFPNLRVIDQQFNTEGHLGSNRRLRACIDFTVAENETIVNELVQMHAEDPSHIVHIPNGIDLARYQPSIRTEVKRPHGIPPDRKVVSYVGRLSHEKGPDLFLEIAARMASVDPALFFILAGPGLLDHALREQAQRLGLSERVLMPGCIDTVEYLSHSDVLIVPSRIDGRPNVVIEAFALGTPVIAAAVGGIPELAGNGTRGLLCAPECVDQFVSAALALLSDPAKARSLSAAAREYVASELDDARLLARYLPLLAVQPAADLSEQQSTNTARTQ